MAVVRDILESIHQRRGGANSGSDLFSVVDSYALTLAEGTIGITPISFSYPPGHVYRYGTNIKPGTTDMTAAINIAANVCRQGGCLLQIPQDVKLLVTSSLNFSRLHAVGLGSALGFNGGIQASAAQFDIITSTGGMILDSVWVDGGWDGATAGLSGDSLSLTAVSPAHPYINTLTNCNFQNNKKRGIYIERGGYTSLFHCAVIASGLHGLECFGLNTDGCTSIRDYGSQYGGTPFGYGIKLTECAAMIFQGTIVEATCGIQLNGVDNRTIVFDGIYEEFNPTPSFTAKIDNGAGGVGTTLTVTAPASLAGLGVGSIISGAGVTANTVIVAGISGLGGTGTYTVNNAQNIASEAMTATALLFVDNGAGLGLSIKGMFGANLHFPFAPGVPSFSNWQDVYFSGNSNLAEGPIPLANRVFQADSGQITTAAHGALSVTVISFSLIPGNWMIEGTLQTADGGAANLQDASFVLTTDVTNSGAASGTLTFEVGTARVYAVPSGSAARLSARTFYANLTGTSATFYMRAFLNNSAGTLAYRGFMTAVKVS